MPKPFVIPLTAPQLLFDQYLISLFEPRTTICRNPSVVQTQTITHKPTSIELATGFLFRQITPARRRDREKLKPTESTSQPQKENLSLIYSNTSSKTNRLQSFKNEGRRHS